MTATSLKPHTTPAASTPLLSFQKMGLAYPTPKGPYPVLENINLEIESGEFICVIGHSGCGKSTLLNTVSGFAKPTSGQVLLHGQPIQRPGPDRMVVFQGYALLPWLTAYENVALGIESVKPNLSARETRELVMEHLELVGLTAATEKTVTQISGGMKQRVAIARALAIRPEVLILDEPFGALDAITKEELQEELLNIWNTQKCTVLMITHDIDEALFLADRLVMMSNGPAAGIGEVLNIDFPRPRNREDIMEDPRYYELRNNALDFLYNRFSHDDE